MTKLYYYQYIVCLSVRLCVTRWYSL